MKKERITKEEFTTNSDSLYPLVDDMLNSRRKALEEINRLFDLDITVDFNSSWNIRSLENDSYIDGLNQDKDTNIEDTIEENIEENAEENIEENVEEDVEDDTKEPTDEEIEPTDEKNVEDEEDEKKMKKMLKMKKMKRR